MGRAYNPVHPCSQCGQPTRSKYPVCGRRKCQAEYNRFAQAEGRKTDKGRERQRRYRQGDAYQALVRTDRFKERRNSALRRLRQERKNAPSVYAVWFPAPQVLKIGFTAHTRNSDFVAVARTRATRRGFDAAGSSCIWRMPGDTRLEAWVQATLAFRWRAAFDQKHTRVCEWFTVPGLSPEEVVEVLKEVYGLVPPDLTQGDPDEEELPPAGMPIPLW